MLEYWWPCGYVYLFVLKASVVFQKGLGVFPACQRSNSTNTSDINNVLERAAGAIAKDGPLHMSRFELATPHLDLSICTNQDLRNIQGIVVIL